MEIIYSDTSEDLGDEAYYNVREMWLDDMGLSWKDEDKFDEYEHEDEIDAEYKRLYDMYWEMLEDSLKGFFNSTKCIIAGGKWGDRHTFVQNGEFTWSKSWQDILYQIEHRKCNLVVYQDDDGSLIFEVITYTKVDGYPILKRLFAVRKITNQGERYLNKNGWDYEDELDKVFNSDTMSKTPNLGLMHP